MIRGIGPVYARALVRAFGEAVFERIEPEPARLREVPGIGAKRTARIVASWADQKAIREIMLFLHANGVGTSRAVRIFKTYGQHAIAVITENPYRLARDICVRVVPRRRGGGRSARSRRPWIVPVVTFWL
jgi:exodeoxyribonuclease V alpha subunit